MSWEASAYARALRVCPNGEPILRPEKLVLLCLADRHNTDEHGAWPSIETLSEDALYKIRQCLEILHSLERKGVLKIVKRRTGNIQLSSFYRFVEIDGEIARARNAHAISRENSAKTQNAPAISRENTPEIAPKPPIEPPRVEPPRKPPEYVSPSQDFEGEDDDPQASPAVPTPELELLEAVESEDEKPITPADRETLQKAREVFDYYREKIQPGARDPATQQIKARLSMFTVGELKKAIDHFVHDEWEMEHNGHRSAPWFFKSNQRVESYINMNPRKSGAANGTARNGAVRGGRGPVLQDDDGSDDLIAKLYRGEPVGKAESQEAG